MKDLDHIETPESDKIVIEQNIKKTIEFIGSQRKIKGLTMFELNLSAMTLVPATYKESNLVVGDKFNTVVYKLMAKEGCVYIQALNKKNAYKKIAKATHTKK